MFIYQNVPSQLPKSNEVNQNVCTFSSCMRYDHFNVTLSLWIRFLLPTVLYTNKSFSYNPCLQTNSIHSSKQTFVDKYFEILFTMFWPLIHVPHSSQHCARNLKTRIVSGLRTSCINKPVKNVAACHLEKLPVYTLAQFSRLPIYWATQIYDCQMCIL